MDRPARDALPSPRSLFGLWQAFSDCLSVGRIACDDAREYADEVLAACPV